MPLILGTNSIKDTGYDVDNSLRFDAGSSDSLSQTQSNGETKTFTYSCWFKKNRDLGSTDQDAIFTVGDNNTNDFLLYFQQAEDIIDIIVRDSSTIRGRLTTNRKFRDYSAWIHIVFAYDSTNATAGNRMRLYINGVEETSFSTDTNPSLNQTTVINNSSYTMRIGRLRTDARYLSGYLSECVLIDGTALDPTSFGEFDEDSGIWKPIDVSGLTFGTNGFYLDFKDSSALGNDVSGNDNDFTVNNLTAIDQSTDTCTNNFATLNPLEAEDNSPTYSDGNLTQTTPTTGGSGGRSSIEIPHTGVWYWEVKIVSVTGTVGDNIRLGISTDSPSSNDGQSIKYMSNGQSVIPGSASSYGATYTAGDIIGIKVDADNNQVTFYKNGASQGAISYTMVAGETYKAVVGEFSNTIGCVYSINFGNPPFTISSGNTDANGYGNFEYSTDSGYALNTKNLAEYG